MNYGTSPTGTTSTWNNGVYVDQLCFYAGEPGNNQVININNALSASGTGVQLAGFNYSFSPKTTMVEIMLDRII
jgi:hypothetical protein